MCSEELGRLCCCTIVTLRLKEFRRKAPAAVCAATLSDANADAGRFGRLGISEIPARADAASMFLQSAEFAAISIPSEVKSH
jgi:hypothetical protein